MDDPLALDESTTAVDEAVLHRIVDADGAVESPYNQFGTLVAKVRTVFPYLVDVARDRDCTHHGDVARECGIHPARQRQVLRVVGLHEDALGRPLLPAVVTGVGAETAGDSFFRTVEMAPGQPDDVPSASDERRWWWETHRAEVYREWAPAGRRARGEPRTTTIP